MECRHGIMKAFPKVKRAKALHGKDAPPVKKKPDECDVTGNTFNGVTVYILPAGIGNARYQIFQRQIQQNGGQTESSLCPSVTHVVVDDNMNIDRALRLLKVDYMPSGVHLLKCTWLSLCISEKQMLDVDSYSLLLPKRESETRHENIKEELPNVKPSVQPVSDQNNQEETIDMTVPDTKEEVQGEEDGVSQSDLEALITGQHPKEETPGPSLDPGPDSAAQKLVSGKWEACQIPGIGKRMADKIDEIMESGHLRKLDHIGEAVPVLELFSNIWGAGVKTAQLWYQQGFRTLEDIRTKAHLSNTQKIGLKHYNDFLDRMPREEAAAIEKVVRDATQAIDPQLVAMACGSYRRRKATCGDVDVLITHPDGKSHKGVFSKVLQSLHDSGFLTDDLVSHEENGEQKKYMGVCRLPGPGHRHRRLDIIVVPYNEFACALMYFTGSAHFNRSMRALAKTKNMSLSEHSLNKDVVRHGNLKMYGGTPLSTLTEEDVFSLLGIPYRQAHERDW
ncbi:DNA polymerase lambda isoform X2 [Micropterus salmoides]|uniref:DNA polymerase lambda isoform X2 n=1 Tax=Micropterus salmoides TaxID=27706 RepID=UPI0018EC0806|nr:DNA polymerase lambda isoform X2 [Micropterus salmoides]